MHLLRHNQSVMQALRRTPAAFTSKGLWGGIESHFCALGGRGASGAAGAAQAVRRCSSGANKAAGSLDLGLNFSTINFDEVAKATQAAMAQERWSGGRMGSSSSEKATEAERKRIAEVVVAEKKKDVGHSTAAVPSSLVTEEPRVNRAVSDIGGDGRSRSVGRNSLYGALERCVAQRNWRGAYNRFDQALMDACRLVVLPAAPSTHLDSVFALGGGQVNSGESLAGKHDVASHRESECLRALRKMMAALPPFSTGDLSATVSRNISMKQLRGIMRWNGSHYYLVLKILIEAGRIEEMNRVWSVMREIGYFEYQLEEKTANNLIALLRSTAKNDVAIADSLTAAVVGQSNTTADKAEERKLLWRRSVLEVQQFAKLRKLQLDTASQRVVETARIAAALHANTNLEMPSSSSEAAVKGSTVGAEDDGSTAEVGDFDGLLRQCTSQEATERVLAMMNKLQVCIDSTSYASIIHSLHNPMYVLKGHTREALVAQQQGAVNDGAAGLSPSEADPLHSDTTTKLPYELYKQQRIDAARHWFHECPQEKRTAAVYNELLYLLRSRAHWKDFDAVLVEFRGNAVRSMTEWPLQADSALADVSVKSLTAKDDLALSPLISAQWRTPPNGKTYELLIHRARYIHDWSVMWALYGEMRSMRIRGTPRVYEVLIAVTQQHPPDFLLAQKKDPSTFLLELYNEMRGSGGEVRSLRNTLNVVNAWSSTRKTRRWDK